MTDSKAELFSTNNKIAAAILIVFIINTAIFVANYNNDNDDVTAQAQAQEQEITFKLYGNHTEDIASDTA
jgi:hypothetical protein